MNTFSKRSDYSLQKLKSLLTFWTAMIVTI